MRGVVTIDGPAASGKTSVAKRLAERLGVPYLSSGLLYRAAALWALREGLWEEPALLEALEGAGLRLLLPENRVLTGKGEDLTPFLHTEAVDRVVSEVARMGGVRAWVNARLKEVPPPFVAEGRDMGRAVFPEAPHKFYLTAPLEVRARRRLGERGLPLEAVLEELRARDAKDQANSLPAPDALLIDTGDLDLEGVVDRILAHLKD